LFVHSVGNKNDVFVLVDSGGYWNCVVFV